MHFVSSTSALLATCMCQISSRKNAKNSGLLLHWKLNERRWQLLTFTNMKPSFLGCIFLLHWLIMANFPLWHAAENHSNFIYQNILHIQSKRMNTNTMTTMMPCWHVSQKELGIPSHREIFSLNPTFESNTMITFCRRYLTSGLTFGLKSDPRPLSANFVAFHNLLQKWR